jgi:eukaryotic-like serine/threonine-protein kinase
VAEETGDDFAGTERFEVVRRIGAGGMGVVYEAFDRERHVTIALKTLRTLRPDALLRFKQEFRALADIQHTNLVGLGELFEDRERWFFTMEMVRGIHFLDYVRRADEEDEADADGEGSRATESQATAEQPTVDIPSGDGAPRASRPRIHSGKLASGADEARLRAAFAQLALGLVALHRAQKVHRDIKPSNIMVTPEGRVVVLDFGLVADLLNMIPESHLVGTFSYMAPEQAGLRAIGPAADWYSVGVLLYQALTGRLPVTGAAREVLVLKQAFEPAAPHVIAEVPDDLDELCTRLLRIDPAARPSGAEILRILQVEERESIVATKGHTPHFVGRLMEIEALRKAFTTTRRDRGVTFFAHGESGVGKSALIRRFTDALVAEERETVVLAGRCYERESVPYKAVDGIIDALSRWLTPLPEGALAAILPRQRGLLGQVFPVMRRLEAVAQAPRAAPGALDPQVLRARLFFALRDLFTRLADRRPLVLVIDDLQWADADSLALLADVMRHPGAPRLLLLATMRSALTTETRLAEARGEALPLRSIDEIAALFSGDVRRLHIEALPPRDARELCDALLRDAGAGAEVNAEALAAEAGGHPLFIDELVRHKLLLGDQAGPLRLQEALRARIARLDTGARQFLDLTVVAGAPLPQEVAAAAAKIDFGELTRRVSVLRAANLVRTAGARRTDTIEPYHDRVREAVLIGLDADAERALHLRLALALEASHTADPEALAEHWRGAGDTEKAATYAVWAAAQAAEALAFDRAARLYKLALELRPREGEEGVSLRIRLGDALANAGRGAQAAEAYLAAVSTMPADAPSEPILDLRRKIAEQLLRAGLVDEGLEQLGILLATIDMELPKTPRRALASLLVRRAQVRLRGIGFRERPAAEIPPSLLQRADICWSASIVLGMVDNIRAADFQARGLLLALDAGEPFRVARALAAEACFASTAGNGGKPRTELLLAAAAACAERAAHPFALAFSAMADGVAAYCMGEFRRSHESSVRAKEMLTNRCTGVAWERETADLYIILSSFYLGRLKEQSQRVDQGARLADERGDLFASTYVRSGLAMMSWLARGDPEGARVEVTRTEERWSNRGYFLAHFWCFIASAQIDLYAGDPRRALGRVEAEWPRLTQSLMLRSIQIVRVESHHVRARALLALAAAEGDRGRRERLLREGASDADQLADEKLAYATPLAALVRAGIAATRGERGGAATQLAAAIAGFEAADMLLYAAVTRLRQGELLGDDAVVAAAHARMAEENIRDTARFAEMLAPGFPASSG